MTQKLFALISSFIASILTIYVADQFRKGNFFIDNSTLSQAVGFIIAFLFMLIIVNYAFKFLSDRKWKNALLVLIVILLIGFVIDNGSGKSIKYTLKISPFYITFILGLIAGYYYSIISNRRFVIPLLLFLFPLLMSIGGYNLWMHRVEYGNFYGTVEKNKVIPFELIARDGENITNESLKGKVVLFDFWYISCRPCWVKFPELQRIYDDYKTNPEIKIYAVNRPTERDKPGELFARIEEKDYSFPVLKGTQEVMDAFEVYVYPTVVILDREGKVVFMGELEDAKKTIQKLL